MKLLIAGDTHGDIVNVKHKIDMAVKHKAQRVIVLGDFGAWWGFDGIRFLDDVNAYAREHGRQVFAIPGNHEAYADVWKPMVNSAYASGATSRGWAYVRTHVLLSPRTLLFKWGGKQFAVAGGAVSIDKNYRMQYERTKGKKIWCADEQLTEQEADALVEQSDGVEIDYLLTHDCSNRTPWKARLKPDIDSQIHRERIDMVLKGVRPRVHLHGHMHERYEWENMVAVDSGTPVYTNTYGLECNRDKDSWGILDIESDEFTFATDLE